MHRLFSMLYALVLAVPMMIAPIVTNAPLGVQWCLMTLCMTASFFSLERSEMGTEHLPVSSGSTEDAHVDSQESTA